MQNSETQKEKDSDPKTAKDRQVMAQKSKKKRRLSMFIFMI